MLFRFQSAFLNSLPEVIIHCLEAALLCPVITLSFKFKYFAKRPYLPVVLSCITVVILVTTDLAVPIYYNFMNSEEVPPLRWLKKIFSFPIRECEFHANILHEVFFEFTYKYWTFSGQLTYRMQFWRATFSYHSRKIFTLRFWVLLLLRVILRFCFSSRTEICPILLRGWVWNYFLLILSCDYELVFREFFFRIFYQELCWLFIIEFKTIVRLFPMNQFQDNASRPMFWWYSSFCVCLQVTISRSIFMM